MSFIFTLVTPPSYLTSSYTKIIEHNFPFLNHQWLSQDEAIDLYAPAFIKHQDQALEIYNQIKNNLPLNQADLFLTTSQNRKKRLLIADMDSTIVRTETLDDLASKVGIGERISAITKRAMNGELNFEEALKERIKLLKNISVDYLKETWNKTKLNKGAKLLVATMKNHGAYTVLISGGFTYFTERVSQACHFNENHANKLSIQNNKLDGTIIPPILGKEAKLHHLKRIIKLLNLSIEESIAIGDGANDLPMLKYAGLGLGFYPKPIVAKQLVNKIQHTSLTSALFIQGYKRSEFIIQQ